MYRSAVSALLVLVFVSGNALASGSDAPFARDDVRGTAATTVAATPALPSPSGTGTAGTLRNVMRLSVMFALVTFALAVVDLAAMGLLEHLRDVGAEDLPVDAAGEPLRLDTALRS